MKLKELQDWYELHQFNKYSGNFETKELAEFLKVSPRTIQRWLKEKTKPTKIQLSLIMEYLKQKQISKKQSL